MKYMGFEVPEDFKPPECVHAIEKWCANCDFDCDTFERIPHYRKYSSLHFLDEPDK
tara:strand:- start:478 stop:645 length:168 start_codon:yes stop_codon:yes gene_type:complete